MGFWKSLREGWDCLWGLAFRNPGLTGEEREREIERLEGLLAEVRAQQKREDGEYAERARTIAAHGPAEAGLPPEILEKKLENLRRVREGRLQALEQEYLRHLERLGAGQDKG